MKSLRARLLTPQYLLAAMVAFYVLAGALVGGLLMWADLDETEGQTEAQTRDLVRLIEEHVLRTLGTAEMAVERVADRVATAGGVDKAVAAPGARAALAAMLQQAPFIGNVYLVDTAGRLALDLGGFHPPGTSFAERDWVTALSSAKAGSFVGQVRLDDATRSFAFTVARRIDGPGGLPLGFVAVTVEVDYFRRFYGSLGIGPNRAIGVYKMDGSILVRLPLRIEDIGRNMARNPIFGYVAKAPEGDYRGESPYDGVMRVVSYRTAEKRNLLVWVAVGEHDSRAAWRQRSIRTAVLLAVTMLATLALAMVLGRRMAAERRAATELATVNADLSRSNADLEQFAYIASHDLKEPLRNIASYVQLLQRRYHGKLDGDADAFIGYTVEGVARLQTIINELLAYSRLGTGRPTLAPVQAGAAVSAALTALKSVIAEAQAAIEVAAQMPVLQADGAQLTSLFQNLIGNAVKYRREEVRPSIVVGCEDRGRDWAFFVRDNGIGIEPQYHGQIFDVFKRLHPRDRFSGSGIGLSIAKRVVERHGGRIWVESQPGAGSVFWFTMPKDV